MTDYRVTEIDCDRIINSSWSSEKKRKFLQICFSKEENIDTFCRWTFPQAFSRPFGKFHYDLIEEYLRPDNTADAEPRGHGKSTLVGLGMVMWELVNKKFSYGVYTSQNHQKSIDFLEPIRNEIKTNERLKFVYPHLNIKNVHFENERDRQDLIDVAGVRLLALSFDKNIRGLKFLHQRPDRIWLDDIEDDQRVLNPELRRKDADKLNKQIIPSLDIDKGKIKFFGTILNHGSLLVTKIRQWNGHINKACELDEDGHVIPGTILFPGMFTVEVLERKRADMGSSAFASEYLNNPIDDTSALIKRKWVKSCFCKELSFDDTRMYKYDIKIQGVDFAFSDRVTADKSAFLTIGRWTGCVDLVDFYEKKGMSPLEQFDYIKYLSGINNVTDNALEENSINNVKKHIGEYEFPYTLFWTGANDPSARKQLDQEFDNKRHTVGKVAMIKRLAAFIERNYNSIQENEGWTFRIPYKSERDKTIAHNLMDQLCSWALNDGKIVEIGVHPDAPIALALALERLNMETFEAIGGVLEI